MTDFYIAYHGSSSKYADTIASRLERSNYEISRIPVLGEAGPYLSERLVNLKRPIILLVSDNLLKSTIGMYDALSVLKSLIKDELIYPIVVDGQYGVDGAIKAIPTNFSKVSEVISYMNYWRDIFLEKRKEKRGFLGAPSEEQTKKIQELRVISAETGEYLRLLRDIEHIRYEDIIASDFELLYNFISKQRYVQVRQADVAPNSSLDVTIPPDNTSLEESKSTLDRIIEHSAQTSQISNITEEDGFVEVKNIELDLSNGFDKPLISDKPLTEMVKPMEANPAHAQDDLFRKATLQDAEGANFDHTKEIIADSIAIFEARQYEAGFLFLEDYLKYNPTNIDVRMHLANMRYDFGDKEMAADDIRYIIKLNDSNAKAHKWIAEYYEIRGEHEKALHHLLRVQALEPDSFEIDYRIGLLLKDQVKDSKTARQYFESALEKNPNDEKSRHILESLSKEDAEEDNELGQPSEAPEAPEASKPKEVSHHELAKSFVMLNEFEKAKQHYRLAKEQNPELRDERIEALIAKEKKKKKQKERLENIRKAVSGEISDDMSIKGNKPSKAATKVKSKKQRPSKKKKKVKTILITGATAGIGRATALELAGRGHRLILTGRRADRLADLKSSLKKGKAKTLLFDVRDFEAAKTAVKSLNGKWAKIDILINNAGLAQGKDPVHEADMSDWNTMIDTNVKGILHMTRIVAPQMAKRQKGHIINVCSTAGHEVYPGGSVYCASKYAVKAVTKGTRLDLHKYNIRVSQVSPGAVEETEFAKVRFHGDEEKAKIYENFTPINSKDVAKVIRFIITRPKRVNIEDVLVMGTQQASALVFDKSGRKNG